MTKSSPTILIATPYFHPRIGGLEHYAGQIGAGLAERGWNVHVVTSGQHTETIQLGNVTVHRYKTWLTIANTPVSPIWPWQIRRLIKQLRPDVINVHAPVPSIALATAAVAGRTPLAVTYHAGSMKKGRPVPDALIYLYERILMPALLDRADTIICASEFVREQFLSRWSAKATTITPGVDTALFKPAKAIADPSSIVFVGDFRDPRKGLDHLLDAIRPLKKAHLTVVGPGTPKPQFGVNYTGALSGPEVAKAIRSAGLLVLPSTTEAESFGMVLLEAMACGIPVIGSDIGGIPHVIADGRDGLLVPPANSKSLTATIRRLISDPRLARQYGAAGRRQVARNYTWTRRVDATHDLLATTANPAQRVLLLHNIVAPYRLPVFEEVGRGYNLDVWFSKAKTKDRLWSSSLGHQAFNHRILPSMQLGPFIINPTIIWQLLRCRYDAYIVGDFPETAFTTFAAIIAAKLRRRPVILWSETTSHEVNYFQSLAVSNNLHHKLVRQTLTAVITSYRRLLLRLPDRYVALSQMARKFLEGEGINPRRIDSGIQVMPASLLPAPTTTKSRSRYARRHTILYFGYLNLGKDIATLIQSVRSISDPNLRLIIAGSGPAEAQLRELAAGDARIEFPGYVFDATERANYFAWADVMVLPTLADCWAMVVNEAMHYGVPVITTTAAGAGELLGRSRSGLIVPPADPAALTKALRKLLTNSTTRAAMAKASRHRTDITDPAVGARPIIAAIQHLGGAR